MRLLLLALAAWLFAATAQAQWSDPDLGPAVREGSASREHLWLLGASGRLVRFDRLTGAREVVAEDVTDLLEDGPRLWAAAKSAGFGYTVRDVRSEEARVATLHVRSLERLILLPRGLGALGGDAILFPTRPGVWLDIDLPALIPDLAPSAAAATADGAVYFGLNHGEWGGGLRRIEPDGTEISIVSRGNINALAQDPEHRGCILHAAGVSHRGSSGEIGRTCGRETVVLHRAPRPSSSPGERAGSTWPMEGLVLLKDGWLATSEDRYYRARAGQVVEQPYPELVSWSGLRLSRETDGVLFLQAPVEEAAGQGGLLRLIALPVRD